MNNLPTAARRLPPASRRQPTATRRGFTLIELMIVITIIAVLASILIPAVNAVMTRARLATVTTELSSMETAIAEFESKFGKQPPSFVTFDTAHDQWPATKAILRSMFPEINFGTPLTTDLTNAGLAGKTLYGPEALVFFLGGIRRSEDTNGNGTLDPGEDRNGNGAIDLTNELAGFSKNPARPFAQPVSLSASRNGPFFEFDASRLGEVRRNAAGVYQETVTDIKMFEGDPLAYLDSLEGQTDPILYMSTSRTKTYAPNDSGLLAPTGDPWTPYQKSPKSYYNPKSFQMISPGYDGEYGVGGIYNEDDPSALAQGDRDNLTNFSDGQLGG